MILAPLLAPVAQRIHVWQAKRRVAKLRAEVEMLNLLRERLQAGELFRETNEEEDDSPMWVLRVRYWLALSRDTLRRPVVWALAALRDLVEGTGRR
jgi:hypothetical protein